MRPGDLRVRVEDEWAARNLRRHVARIESQIADLSGSGEGAPVLFFNASTRIHRLSLNAAFGLLASWRVRLEGVPVVQVVCRKGLPQCPLGTRRDDLEAPPPCGHCVRFSERIFPSPHVIPMTEAWADPQATSALESADLEALTAWRWRDLPLGELVLPSMRWVLRRHDLEDSQGVRSLYRRYLAGAVAVARRFDDLLPRVLPRAVVVFNGIMYPEAVARAVSRRAGIPVVSHEVGLRPFSAFFSHEEATFRQVRPDLDRQVTPQGEARLDRYLSDRFQGRFSMAGIRFWPEMAPPPKELRRRLEADGEAVVVFTNVVFDTSQVHANHLYGSMFHWLEDVRKAIERHPERLFVVRAHPDETRLGKESRQSVQDWVQSTGLDSLPNVLFIAPEEGVSSYELLRRASVVLVYNSSIGLEASIVGRPVLCAGKARYSGIGAVHEASSQEDYRLLLEAYLRGEGLPATKEQAEAARRFLDFELHRASLDFSRFLEERRGRPGMVALRRFGSEDLSASPDLAVVARGILQNEPFLLEAVDSEGIIGRFAERTTDEV